MLMARILIAGAVVALLAGPALAGSCPMDMQKVDAALAKNTGLSADKKAQVMKLRAEGEADHKAGKHADSMKKLADALKLAQ
ncbi:MAG: hypothetical protein FJX35_14690 [Alphaproteobacteria bacterium]|nr:hypothetical protein [Alphaproteobacteria bacterium]